jgi:hypothetical protein
MAATVKLAKTIERNIGNALGARAPQDSDDIEPSDMEIESESSSNEFELESDELDEDNELNELR